MLRQALRASALLIAVLLALAWRTAALRGEQTEAPQERTEDAEPLTDSERTLRVQRGGTVGEMTMEQYLLGVLRAEMPASFEPEALKAQAIAARTFVLRHREQTNHPDADVCDDINCCQAYRDAQTAAQDWGGMALYYEQKLAAAVQETDGSVVLYGGEPVLAVFFSSASGYTQGAGAVWQSDLPYLISVESPEDAASVPNYYSSVTLSAQELREALLPTHPEAVFPASARDYFTDIERSEAGYVTSLRFGGVALRGNELRTLLSLRSPCFTVEADDGSVTFHVTGYGHGVGMSQYGANAMAKAGKTAEEILKHYFQGAEVKKR